MCFVRFGFRPDWRNSKILAGNIHCCCCCCAPSRSLSEEIQDYAEWIKPTKAEKRARWTVIGRIEDIVRSQWPDVKLDVFGSFKTGLYLPAR